MPKNSFANFKFCSKSLEQQIIHSLTDMNGWKDIGQIVNKTFGSNNDLKDIKLDASIGDKYFAPISNFTNPLSLDSLGNFQSSY
jgi:hypothetical protein